MATTTAPRFRNYYLDRGTANDSDFADKDPSLTQQHYEPECNINNIMARYLNSGILPEGTPDSALYDDFFHVTDYQSALEILEEAQAQFNALPAATRNAFNNDPAQLLAAVQNAQTDQAIKKQLQDLGMLTAEKPAIVEPPKPAAPAQPAPPTATPAT